MKSIRETHITSPLNDFDWIQEPCYLGIDEAGRGPVLGPMVYGCCFYPKSMNEKVIKMKVDDSKKLKESDRDAIFNRIKGVLGYHLHILHASELSQKMLRRNKYNLNKISHDTAIGMIRHVQSLGVNVQHVFVDTVGDNVKYQTYLQSVFPEIQEIVVEKKADAKYPSVSAASICAKVTRDAVLRDWTFDEPLQSVSRSFGCGYPGDATTKAWLRAHVDPVFGFPTLVRFSWKTIPTLMEQVGATCVEFHEIIDEKKQLFSTPRHAPTSLLQQKRSPFFHSRRLAKTSKTTF